MLPHMGQDIEARRAAAVAETIRAERAAKRMSQAEVAAKAGIPRVTYIRYETGERRPNMVQVIQIAEALGLSIGAFVSRVEHRLDP